MASQWRIRGWLRSDPPNLLLTTLGVTPSPFRQTDWPNPQAPRQPQENQGFVRAANVRLIGLDKFFAARGQAPTYDWPNPQVPRRLVQADCQSSLLVGPLAVPFAQADWPNPQQPRQSQENQGFVRSANVRLAGLDRFFASAGQAPAYDWPNPQQPRWPAQDDYRANLLLGPLAVPFAQADWPNPQQPRQPEENRGFVRPANTRLAGQDRFFAAAGQAPTYDYPNPQAPRRLVQADCQTSLLVGPLAVPFAQRDWPLPPLPWQPQENQGFVHATDARLAGKDLFFGAPGQGPSYDWPNPQRPRHPVQPEPPPNLLTTTFALVVTPFFQTDWPNPRPAPQPAENRDFTRPAGVRFLGQDRFFASAGQAPVYDWPSPLPPRRLIQADCQSSLLVGLSVVFPFSQADWPNPQAPRRLVRDDCQSSLLVGPLAVPFAQTEWPLPPRPSPPAQDDYRANLLLGPLARPFFQADWPNPQPARPPAQPELFGTLLVGPPAVPFSQSDWPLPPTPRQPQENQGFVRAAGVQLFGQDRFFAAAGRAPVYDWPNPPRPRPVAQPDSPGSPLVGLLAVPFLAGPFRADVILVYCPGPAAGQGFGPGPGDNTSAGFYSPGPAAGQGVTP